MKGFIFISGSEIIPRFLASGAFKSLEKAHDITYIALRTGGDSSDTSLREALGQGEHRVEWIPLYWGRFERWNDLFDISCLMNNDRSSSFAVRNQERARADPSWLRRLEGLARPGVYEKHRDSLEREMGLNPAIVRLALRDRPDFFVLPSSLLDYLTDDVLQIGDMLSIPTLMLVAGWDNLSSKGLLYHKPSMMGVWGEQSKRHAIEIQEVAAESIRVIGAPHYERFYSTDDLNRTAFKEELGVPCKGRLILFAGTVRLFDETGFLRDLDRMIESGILPEMHILYRPHPLRHTRMKEENFCDLTMHHITMDPRIEKTYQATKKKGKMVEPDDFLSRLDHLAHLYQTVDAVISPMSTVLLEAMLYGLPTMAVAFGDGKHSWSADKVSKMYHFKELYEIPGVIISRDREKAFDDIRRLVSLIGDRDLGKRLESGTQYFVYHDQEHYSEKVPFLAEEMMSRALRSPAYDSPHAKPGRTFSEHAILKRILRPDLWQAARRKVSRAVRGDSNA